METEVAVTEQQEARSKKGNLIDGRAIRLLGRGKPDPEVSEKDLDRALRDMADAARRRMVINNSGGLPGPPSEPLPLRRKIGDFIDRLIERCGES